MPTINIDNATSTFADELRKLHAKYGDHVMQTFAASSRAWSYIRHHALEGWVSVMCTASDGREWCMIRPAAVAPTLPVAAPAAATPRTAAPRASKGPTAKSLCLSVYVQGIERDAFVAAAVALGVKDVTAKTMFSDIKAGRIS